MMLRPVLATLVLVVLATAALVGAAPAGAAYPGTNGKLAFTSLKDGPRHIFTTGPGGIKDLSGASSPAEETQPQFSPNGRQIVFTRGASGQPNTEIYAMSAGGTNRRALTHTSTGNDYATWSPNGKQIAFVSTRNRVEGDIYVMNANGTNVRRVTNDRWSESDLSWSSTNRIAFVRTAPGGSDEDIWSISPNGSGLRNLTRDPNNDEVQSDWSPNGRQLVYSGTLHPSGSVGADLWIVNADGTHRHPLQHESNGYSDGSSPAWSPDGKTIAFVANNGTGHPGIWKVPATGGTNIQVVNENGNFLDAEVNWQALT